MVKGIHREERGIVDLPGCHIVEGFSLANLTRGMHDGLTEQNRILARNVTTLPMKQAGIAGGIQHRPPERSEMVRGANDP
jgi:hypothetical protein